MGIKNKIGKLLFGNLIKEEIFINEVKTVIRTDSIKEFIRLQSENRKKILEYRDEHGASLLHYAVSKGAKAIVKKLVNDRYFHVDVENLNEFTPFHVAVVAGNVEIASFLIQNGADINKISRNATPLINAVANGNIKLVKFLLESGASIEVQSEGICESAFLSAMQTSRYDIAKLLLSYGVNLKSKGSGNYYALHLDAMNKGGMLSELVSLGLPVDSRTNTGRTALFETINFSKYYNACSLISMGADVSAQDNNGDFVLYNQYPLFNPDKHIEMLKLFIDSGFDVNSTTPYGETLLHNAVFFDQPKSVSLLIKHNANIDATMNDASDREHARGYVESKSFEQHCKINKISPIKGWCDGWTPLHLAAKNGCMDCMKILLQQQAKVNLKNKDGFTPLDIAYKVGYKLKVDLLLTHGALRGNQI